MLLRYADRPLSAIGVGYLLAVSVPAHDAGPAELDLSFRTTRPAREISRRTVSSIFIGLAAIGFTFIFYGPPVRKTGLILGITAGLVSIGASVGQMVGAWDWAEYREKRENEEDRVRLERVLGALEAPWSAQGMIKELVDGRKMTVSFETSYGTLVTARTQGGYDIMLEGEKPRQVALSQATVSQSEPTWIHTAANLMRDEEKGKWEALLDLYR